MRISIALCTYNGAQFIDEQLASLAAQSLLPDELILCDDCSTDETIELALNFASRAPFKVFIVKNDARLGVTGNFEKAISLCTGEIIFLCDQDDYWLPGKLRQVAMHFEEHEDVGLIFSDAVVTDRALVPLGYTMWNTIQFTRKRQAQLSGEDSLIVLGSRYVVTGATLAFRSNLKKDIIPIPANFFHDAWIAFIAAARSRLIPINEPLIYYRQHDTNVIGGIKFSYLQSVMNAINRPSSWFNSEIARLTILLQRLSLISAPEENRRGIIFLEVKIKHLEKRRDIFFVPVFARIVFSTKELFSLRYFKYSEGFASFFIDLFFRRKPKVTP